MPQQAGQAVENNFNKGLITEATGLNFPENSCTETFDCVFNYAGSVTRRGGFDFEDSFGVKAIDRSNRAIRTYLWKNVSGNGDVTVEVVQIGATIYFYKTNTQNALSNGAVSTTVTLTPVSGAPAPDAIEAQFCDGNGLLFVTHPYCEPMYVSYDTSSDTTTSTNITIQIRDEQGAIADPNAVDARPTSTLAALNVNHLYNLYNQGWTTTNLTTWDTNLTTMPSNADVMWRFKNSSDAFDTATVPNVVTGNTPAAKGHFILTLSNQARDAAAGTSGVAATTTGSQRPTTAAFFAGRVFYSGINFVGFNSNIYFTQIIESSTQYGSCYQANDPTSQDTFDLLDDDGGVIHINDAGTIFKLFAVPGGLAVFAANGVWFITGSTGLGFTATDYTVQKLTYIQTVSSSSFVDVLGFPCWWNNEGIYYMSQGSVSGGTLPEIKSLTDVTIKSFYDTISSTSKRFARGFYHNIEKKITWVYRSGETQQVTQQYEFDRALNFDVRTGAFYPWIISQGTSGPRVHSVTTTDGSTGFTSTNNVIDGSSNNVIDGSSNQVIEFGVSGSTSAPANKFLVSYPSGGSYNFTFAEARVGNYDDWLTFDGQGIDFTSYFISGFRLRGGGMRKFGTNWLNLYSDTSEFDSQYYMQALWDYATSGTTGRWSPAQLVQHSAGSYSNQKRRLKVPGHGLALQFKISSVPGQPFTLDGWSEFSTGNNLP